MLTHLHSINTESLSRMYGHCTGTLYETVLFVLPYSLPIITQYWTGREPSSDWRHHWRRHRRIGTVIGLIKEHIFVHHRIIKMKWFYIELSCTKCVHVCVYCQADAMERRSLLVSLYGDQSTVSGEAVVVFEIVVKISTEFAVVLSPWLAYFVYWIFLWII